MTTRSASSRSAARGTAKSRGTSTHGAAKAPKITAEEFDRRANLPPDDPAGDLEPYLDHDKAQRPGRAVQRVNVDFPTAMLLVIDHEAARLGVTRQAFIKIRLADTLPTNTVRARAQAQLAVVDSQHGRTALARTKKKRAKG